MKIVEGSKDIIVGVLRHKKRKRERVKDVSLG